MKKAKILSCIIIIPLLLTSCWNYREADNLTLVRGFTVDKIEDGGYLLSSETADMHESGKEGSAKSVIIESRGKTLFEAVRNALMVNVPKLYWAHTSVCIISQQLAQEGVTQVLDFLSRDHETRLDMHPVIYKGNEAREVFEAKPLTTELVTEELRDMIHDQKGSSKAMHVQIYEFIENMSNEGISAVMPAICLTEVKGEKTIRLCGTAVFREDKLIGYLDEDETKYLSFVLDVVEGGVLVVNVGSEGGNDKVTLEILNSKTKIKPKYEEGKITIEMKIKIRTVLDDVVTRIQFCHENELKALSKTAGEQLKGNILELIKKAQNSGADIFGFGLLIKRNIPKLWKEMGKDWDKHFKEVEAEIIPEIEIVHTGLLKKTLKIGD